MKQSTSCLNILDLKSDFKKKFPKIKLFCNSISNRILFLSKIFTETENINRINDAENL